MKKNNRKRQGNKPHGLRSTQSEKNQSACTPNDKDEKVTTTAKEIFNLRSSILASSLPLLYVALEVKSGDAIIFTLFAYLYQAIAIMVAMFAIKIKQNTEKFFKHAIFLMDFTSVLALLGAATSIVKKVVEIPDMHPMTLLTLKTPSEIIANLFIYFNGSESLAFLVPLYP